MLIECNNIRGIIYQLCHLCYKLHRIRENNMWQQCWPQNINSRTQIVKKKKKKIIDYELDKSSLYKFEKLTNLTILTINILS